MKIGATLVAPGRPAYLIAEIGVNHEGSLDRAREMVHTCARVGASAAKFQAYKADTLAHVDSPTYFTQTGTAAATQYAFFRRYDAFGPREYEQLARECTAYGIDFLCTPFDLAAVEWLNPLVPAWKIASADITNVPLLEAVAATGKPVLLSTGAATLTDIDRALDIIGWWGVALLHCVLAYPTPAPEANLRAIRTLARHYPRATIGYSDHTLPTNDMAICCTAYALGAEIIEKHYTDNRQRPGNDHAHSMEHKDLAILRQLTEQMRRWMGSGEKAIAPLEADAHRYARRGLYAARALAVGETVCPEDVAILRPTAAIGPEDWHRVLGTRVTTTLAAGEPLRWDALAA